MFKIKTTCTKYNCIKERIEIILELKNHIKITFSESELYSFISHHKLVKDNNRVCADCGRKPKL